MNDRVLTALRDAGFDVRPTATLDKEGALFALTEDTLIYLEGEQSPSAQAQAVTLRDVTRIHSDRDGVLRVETPGGTALTAPLAGFDVGRVQHFFAEVRHATARAKTLPSVGAPRPSGSAWKTGWNAGASEGGSPSSGNPASGGDATASAATHAGQPRAAPVEVPPAGAVTEVKPAEPPAPVRPSDSVRPSDPVRPSEQPATTQPSSVQVISSQPSSSAVAASSPTVSASEPSPAVISSATRPPAQVPSPVKPASTPAPTSATNLLAERGAALAARAPTVQLLALLMGLAGLGVGLLRWRGGDLLDGLWTIAAGAALAFGLYVFSEVARVLGLLAQATGRREE